MMTAMMLPFDTLWGSPAAIIDFILPPTQLLQQYRAHCFSRPAAMLMHISFIIIVILHY